MFRGGEWRVTIIGPDGPDGLVRSDGRAYVRSKNGRLYLASALRQSVALWDGIKVFDNHLTDAEFKKKQGMRSVAKEWIGVITNPVWDEQKHSIVATLKVVDPGLRQKLSNAYEAGVLGSIGLSLDALCEQSRAVVNGKTIAVVEKILRPISVDVVADPAAGGRLARMIAAAVGG